MRTDATGQPPAFSTRAALAMGLAGLVVVFVLGARAFVPALVSVAAPRSAVSGEGGSAGVSAAVGLRRLESLPVQAQSVISGALGSAGNGFAATRSVAGWQIQGGGVRADLAAGGVELSGGGGSLSMTLAAAGRGGRMDSAGVASVSARGNRVVFQRGRMREWYAAGPLGIEQGFTLDRRVRGADGTLALSLALRGPLRARRLGEQVSFLSRSGRVVLRYGGLVAVDASGRRLPSGLVLRGGRLLVRIDDRGARYPVRIDPLIQQGSKLIGSGAGNGSSVGTSVALSSDGNTALVGGYDAAWVFTRSGGVWTQQGPELTGTGGGTYFGASAALSSDGNTALIGGRGSAWAFTRSGSTWSQQSVLAPNNDAGGFFGDSVALSADGNTALIGDDDTTGGDGAAWVFTRSPAGAWTQGQTLTGAGEVGAGSFGSSVSLSADGKTALIGGPLDGGSGDVIRTGAAWVFTQSGGVWSPGPELSGGGESGLAQFGESVALSSDGSTALIGGPFDNTNTGAAWVFTNSGGSWPQQGSKLTASDETGGIGSFFGNSVALSTDGNTALIAGYHDNHYVGAAWVFARSGGVWTQQGAKLTAGDEIGEGFFGSDVAMSSDGDTALIGGYSDNGNVGAAWVFAPPAPTCTNVAANAPVGGGAVTASLACAGPAGVPLTYGIVTGPADGSLGTIDQATGQVTYTSAGGFGGQDAFTYQVSDPWGVSNTATVTITVPRLAVPVCKNVSTKMAKNAKTATVKLSCAGPAGAKLTYAIVTPPAGGKLGKIKQTTGAVTYTPRSGDSGSDRFTYEAMDSGGTSNTATGTIKIPAPARLNSTMGWSFTPTLSTYTVVRALVVYAVPGAAKVKLSCAVKGCGVKAHTESVAIRRVCTGKGKDKKCRTVRPPRTRTVTLTRLVDGLHLRVGARFTVSIVEPGAIGKQYLFKIRANQQPSATIITLAPGSTKPCPSC